MWLDAARGDRIHRIDDPDKIERIVDYDAKPHIDIKAQLSTGEDPLERPGRVGA
ncbi:hypothetical protein SAMN02745121_05144 [Nannocystis exedens]|uniref:Uncharacterized protein n=1 Tax=Nannocystis exedens TaxID=54 RepID=A0A1I2CIS7_9BACT|nr:hypothetical protein [Nannocystis exedens]PCC68288.1 hypothetical protein NAEX_01298 [Nannocystis exedens]SFE67713.1 hypothetical protein SAMN02745121_05144 [Nannocystis exedens]